MVWKGPRSPKQKAITAVLRSYLSHLFSGKKKAHKHKLFCPVGLGTTPGLSRGFRPWDKSGENLGHTRVFSLFFLHSGSPISLGLSLGQARFVPGTIPGTKGGTESLCEKSLCAFFARYILTVRSGPVWRLSPQGPCDSTCQLWTFPKSII